MLASVPVLPSPGVDLLDERLAVLCRQLVERGLHCRVVLEILWSEVDVRLEVRADTGLVTVELLSVPPGALVPLHLDAVRVDRGQREVWRVPSRQSEPEGLVRFVHGLLVDDVADLRRRYVTLG